MGRECRNAREFGDVFRDGVRRRGGGDWCWKKDMRPWLADMLCGARFGDPDFDWSVSAANGLAADFISDASTW